MKNRIFILGFMLACYWVHAQQDWQEDVFLKRLIAKKIKYNKSIKVGYGIQIYNGDEVKARTIKAIFERKYPKIDIKLTYKEPEWKVQTIIYHDRLMAEKNLKAIQETYPNARIF